MNRPTNEEGQEQTAEAGAGEQDRIFHFSSAIFLSADYADYTDLKDREETVRQLGLS